MLSESERVHLFLLCEGECAGCSSDSSLDRGAECVNLLLLHIMDEKNRSMNDAGAVCVCSKFLF
jgi:hypothetical protein